MNLLLLDSDEIDSEGRVLVCGRRAQHLHEVLGVKQGGEVRAGLRRGSIGTAEVVELRGDDIELRYRPTTEATAQPAFDLILALPRPKVLSRILQHAATLGVGRIDLVNAWRVDKSYFDSPRVATAAMDADLILGCEQGRHTWVPELVVHRRFVEFCDHLPAEDPRLRLVAHPGSGGSLAEQGNLICHGRTVVAIGPEGGWIDRELATFERLGFVAVILSASVLRSEAAVVAALAQLELVRSIAS